MSHRIEVGKIACRLSTSGADLFVLYQLSGFNNVISDRTGKFHRSWQVIAFGTKSSIIPKLEMIADIAEAGSIRPLKGRRYTRTSYLKASNARINQAATLQDMIRWSPRYSYFLSHTYVVVEVVWINENKAEFIALTSQFFSQDECDQKMEYSASGDQLRIEIDLLNQKHTNFLVKLIQNLSPPNDSINLLLADILDDEDHLYFNALKPLNNKYPEKLQ
jgi:hypothetical protein